MAKKRWNLHVDEAAVELGNRAADADGVSASTYIERLIRRDAVLRRVREWEARGIDPEQLNLMQKELEAIL